MADLFKKKGLFFVAKATHSLRLDEKCLLNNMRGPILDYWKLCYYLKFLSYLVKTSFDHRDQKGWLPFAFVSTSLPEYAAVKIM